MENGTSSQPEDSQPEIKEVPDDLYRRLCQRTAVPDNEILDCFTYDNRGDHTKKGVFFYQDDDMSTVRGSSKKNMLVNCSDVEIGRWMEATFSQPCGIHDDGRRV
jgi:hypothetical protein